MVGGPDTIKKTVDGGATWTDAFDPGSTAQDFGRGASFGNEIMYTTLFGGVAYSPNYTSAPFTYVVATGSEANKAAVTVGEDGEFYIQNQAGQIKKFNKTTLTFTDYGTISAGYNSQQGYNQALIVKNNIIVTGEFNGNSSTDNGATWTRSLNGYWTSAADPGTYIHSDHHRMGQLDAPLDFWSSNDGGLSYISYSSTTSTTPTITYKTSPVKVTQLYSVAINPSANDGATVISNQDNDSMSKFNNQWYAIAQGDGIQSAVNYNIPAIMYAGNQNGAITQSNTGFAGQLNGNGNQVSIPGASFYFPLEMNKANPNILYGGGTDVSIITSTATTTEVGTLTIAPANSGVTSKVVTIATHGNTIYAASINELKFSSNGGTTWSTITLPTEAVGNITSVDFDAASTNTIYLTYNGYNVGKKVFKSTNGGTAWANISGDLPNIVMNEVMLKQSQTSEYLFVATNLGVYYTTNGGTNWTKLGQGLPNTDVKDIDIHYTGNKLVAGTFGRGLWEISIVNNTLSNESIKNELKVTIYPNPTTDFINISGENKEYNYLIYNVVGGIVKKGTFSNNTPINVKDLASNNYILNITSGQLTKSIKFIKN